jgi:hypothetical protein
VRLVAGLKYFNNLICAYRKSKTGKDLVLAISELDGGPRTDDQPGGEDK